MNVLEKLRQENNLTKADMMQRLEIADSYYSMIINGKRPISKPLALRIKEEFKLSLDEIFFADSFHETRNNKPEAV